MAYKTILVHVDEQPHITERIHVAVQLAQRCGAHLIGAAPSGVSRFVVGSMPPEHHDPTLALHLGYLREQAHKALAAFEIECTKAALASFESRLIDDEAGPGVSLLGRTADLVIIGQSESGQLGDLPAHVITHCGRPVLLVPKQGHHASVGRQIVLAWDASGEAARALLLALPLLRQADKVSLVILESASDVHLLTDTALADPQAMLARHNIVVTTIHQKLAHRRTVQRRSDVGQALLSLSSDLSADLLVMGAYGHSRLRETILGGVTRTVLETMTIPVLMAH
jgi:nucleotide-binding universal stress UspA family protein